jgi:hypothetical protein
MPTVLLDWQRISITKTEQTLTGTGPLGATVGVRLNPLGWNCAATTRSFLFQKRKFKSENMFIAPSEPMIECPAEICGGAT